MESQKAFCSNCGVEGNSTQNFCGSCGNKLDPGKVWAPPSQKSKNSAVQIVAGVVVACILFVYFLGQGKSGGETERGAEPNASPTNSSGKEPATSKQLVSAVDVIPVTAEEYYRAYKANEVTADDKYKGKAIQIRGIVRAIGKDLLDKPYVSLGAGDFGEVPVYNIEIEQARKLAVGMEIDVTCFGNGMMLAIPNLDCKKK